MKTTIEMLAFPLLVTLLSLGVFFSIRSLALRFLLRWIDSTSKMGEIVFLSLKTPSFYWCLAIALTIGVGISDIPVRYVSTINKLIEIILILSITVAAANLSGALFRNYIQKLSLPIPQTGLVFGIIKGSILAIGFLIILATLGISIAPLITALGVGGLAVALALQDTLSNLFAGIHILLEKSIRIGDFLRMENGQEGTVEDITWRTTRIRMLSDNMVIIPNNKLSQSIVTNYSLPDKRMVMQIPVSVGYDQDPDRVETLLYDEAHKAVQEVKGLLAEPAPTVRLIPGFGASALEFTLNFRIEEVVNQYRIIHEVRKRILKRFKEEGIEMPFPQQMIHLRKS